MFYYHTKETKLICTQAFPLVHNCLGLAASALVAREASAHTSAVVADTTAGAVTATLVTLASQNIGGGGALNHGAVGATETSIASATVVHLGVPGISILGAVVRSSALQVLADTVTRAAVGALGTAAALTPVAGEAGAHTGLAVADTTAGALNQLSVIVVLLGRCSPSTAGRASTLRAIGTLPRRDLTVGGGRATSDGPSTIAGRSPLTALVAQARVLGASPTRTVTRAAIGAPGRSQSKHAEKSEEGELVHVRVFCW